MKRWPATSLILVTVCLVTVGAGRALVQSLPDGDNTATISGQVVRAHDGGPARFASVSAESLDGTVRRSATANELGHFVITSLAVGQYSVSASAVGYARATWQRTATSRGPTYVVLAPKGHESEIRIQLARGGVITGRVVDEDGIPVEGVPVHALMSEFRGGQDMLRETAARPRLTDDRGYFRLFGLESAEYFVAALPGPFGDQPGASPPGYVLTYAPGVSSVAEAQPVTVAADRESPIGDLIVRPTATGRLRGAVIGPQGGPRAGIELVLTPSSGPLSTLLPRATSDGAGGFVFTNVPPGAYLLRSFPPPATPSEFGVVAVNVSAGETTATLRLQKAAAGRGQVVFEDGAPDFSPRQLLIGLQAADRTQSPLARGGRVTVRDDWTLEFTNVWGPQFVRLLEPPAGWMVRHVYSGPEDFADRPLDFTRDDVQSIRLVLTTRGGIVSGTVRADGNLPAAGARVLVYAVNAQRWFQDERALHWTRADADGRYRSRSLPAGDYLVVAVADLTLRDWPPRPAVLESLRAVAGTVSVTDAGTISRDLSLTGMPR